MKLFELWDRKDAWSRLLTRHAAALEIARGLLHTRHPFLDEPTLGLDPQSRNQLWTHVKY